MPTLKEWLYTPCSTDDLLLYPDSENVYYMPVPIVKRKILYMEEELGVKVGYSNFQHFFHNSPDKKMFISGTIIVTVESRVVFNASEIIILPGAATFKEGRFNDNEHYAATLLSLCITNAFGRKYPQFGSEINLSMGDSYFSENVVKKVPDFMVKKQMANAVIENDQITIDNLNKLYSFV